jgi:membrane dipeptidase
MKRLLIYLFIAFPFLASTQTRDDIHFNSILVDTHNDILSSSVLDGLDIAHRLTTGHSDLVRWKEGGLDVQFFSVWTGERARNKEGFYKDANQEIDSLDAIVSRNNDKIILAKTYEEVLKGIKQKKLVALIGVEGGHMIEGDLDKLNALYKRGMSYMTLTWNNSNGWATSARDETQHGDTLQHKGLTEFGRQVIRRMNELGILVDLSHTGVQTFYDALAVTTKPVLLSHSSVYSICPVFRNVNDEQIKAVAKNGGVICINFNAGFVGKEFSEKESYLEQNSKQLEDSLKAVYPDSVMVHRKLEETIAAKLDPYRPSLSQLIDHIDYIVKLAGDDYVGIGSDFDGVSSLPMMMDDVTKYPLITGELIKRGYTEKSIRKILGGNVLRVMKANMK